MRLREAGLKEAIFFSFLSFRGAKRTRKVERLNASGELARNLSTFRIFATLRAE
jgi:hypothetical protein